MIRLTAASSQYLSLTPILDYNAAYTFMGWISPATLVDGVFLTLGHASSSDFDLLVYDAPGSTIALLSYTTGVPTLSVGGVAVLTLTNPTHVTITRSGDTLTTYVNGIQDATGSGPVAGRLGIDTVLIGAGAGTFFDGGIGAFKAWSRTLSKNEIVAEIPYYSPRTTTNLHAWWSFQDTSDIADRNTGSVTVTLVNTPTSSDVNPIITWQPIQRTKSAIICPTIRA